MTASAARTHDRSPAALRTRDLDVGYRTRRLRHAVLERVNLQARRGNLVCLLGPNGVGKSTLLRTIARMQPPLSGSVELGGVDLERVTLPELAKQVGVVLTERVAVDALSARHVVELGRYPHTGWFGRLTDHDRAVVDWAISAVDAQHLAGRDLTRLSDGERQRMMIARALAQEPSVLVLDEPTAFLDVSSRVELMGLLRRLTRDADLAVVVSTHEIELALRVADTVWLVTRNGKVATGAPEDLVLSGAVARTFESQQIRFQSEERTFRLATGDVGAAVVTGSGQRAAMTRAVLEREGYAIRADHMCDATLRVDAHELGWRVSGDDGERSGDDFASLATFLRNRSAGT